MGGINWCKKEKSPEQDDGSLSDSVDFKSLTSNSFSSSDGYSDNNNNQKENRDLNEDEDDEDSPDEANEPSKKKPGKSLKVNPSFYLTKKDDTDDSVIFAENSIGHESFNESKAQVSIKKSVAKTDESEEEECEYDEDEDDAEDAEDPESNDQIDRQFIYIQVSSICFIDWSENRNK